MEMFGHVLVKRVPPYYRLVFFEEMDPTLRLRDIRKKGCQCGIYWAYAMIFMNSVGHSFKRGCTYLIAMSL